MKKYFILLALVTGFLFFSCSKQDNSVNPEQNNLSNRELIKLPAPTGLSLEKVHTTSVEINGGDGGSLVLEGSYESISGLVAFKAELEIPQGAFHGTKTIAMELDDQYAALIFSPHMVFDKPLKLDFEFEGIQLGNGNGVDFSFIDDNGNLSEVEYENLIAGNGVLSVNKACLEHFSRFIFIK